MRARRLILAAVFALILCLFPLATSAGAQWCDTDPPVQLPLYEGRDAFLLAHLTIGAQGSEHAAAVARATFSVAYEITTTAITTHLYVTVPGRGFATRAILSTGEDGTGVVFDYREGMAGGAIEVTFTSRGVATTKTVGTGLRAMQSESRNPSGCSWANNWCGVTITSTGAAYTEVTFYSYDGGVYGYAWRQVWTNNNAGSAQTWADWDEQFVALWITSQQYVIIYGPYVGA
jgi:hypothetical protein